jgi:exopolysaccharide biosynthesis operon protein EpsL
MFKSGTTMITISLKSHRIIIPALLSFSLSAPTWADEQDVFNFSVGAGATFEDNLFRLPDSANTFQSLGKSRRSDRILTTNVGIKIDKPYSLQRFQVDLNVIDNNYDTYSYLDYTAFNYRAAWLWQLTPNIKGTLSADQQQVLNSFSEFRDFDNELNRRRSIQTNENRIFDVDATVGGGWHLLGGISELRSRNSVTFDATGDFIQTGANVGLKYVTPSENSITLLQRAYNGDYQGRRADALTQLDSGFKQRETEALLQWRLTGKSLIDAKIGYVDREHDNFSSRDYDGMTGRLAYNWQPTGKLGVITSLSRNIYSFQQAVNSYYVADTFAITPIWQLTPKTSLKMRYDFSRRDYRGTVISIPEHRKDNVQSFMLSADWQAMRTLTVTGVLRHEKRNSSFNQASSFGGDLEYDANTATINAQLLF